MYHLVGSVLNIVNSHLGIGKDADVSLIQGFPNLFLLVSCEKFLMLYGIGR